MLTLRYGLLLLKNRKRGEIMEIIIVGLIISLSLVYIARTFYKSINAADSGCGCSNSCGGCGKADGFDKKECSEIIK